jgi:hypothetical protein
MTAPLQTLTSLTHALLQIELNIGGFPSPFTIFYPLGGSTSVQRTAQNFCNDNYERFQLTQESYQSCVDPITGQIENATGEFVLVRQTTLSPFLTVP